ncbi:MAG: NAD(P)/FAD-dependent oxidoreductase, partial [Calditrichaeota bacterium]|nr:NAD(P)/FAD-dependent oxidoreductase [Calditrichota bacterium]
PTLLRWGRVSLGQLAEKARNPLLRRLWMHAFVPEMAAVFVALTVAWMHKKCAGYPLGGSRPLAEKVAASFLAAGGTLHYGARVCKILTRNGRATGVVLADGEEQQAEIVISAADAHMTIFELLGGDFFDSRITKLFQQFTPFPSYVLVALGVARSFADIPHSTLLPCQPPLQLDSGTVVHDLPVRISTFDPMLAPPGKTLISCWLTTRDFAYWLNLRKSDRAKYKEEKERLAMQVVEVLDARYGHVKDCLEMVDVAAPATVIRYTNNYQGSFEGWVLTPQVLTRRIAKTLPGLDGFYMAGHWVEPGGGLPTALLSGRNVAQLICHRDGRPFSPATQPKP